MSLSLNLSLCLSLSLSLILSLSPGILNTFQFVLYDRGCFIYISINLLTSGVVGTDLALKFCKQCRRLDGATTFSIMTLGQMTFRTMALSITMINTTVSIMMLGMMTVDT